MALAVADFDAKGTAAMVQDVVREAIVGTAGNAISTPSASCGKALALAYMSSLIPLRLRLP